ncbi:MAG: hypothetical protein HYX79_06195 [Chloroflexi bacterium]|nr:hypothetical protein [Chloroflexota bacterium]
MEYPIPLVYEKLKEVARAESLTNYTEVGEIVGLDMATDVGRIRIAQILDDINRFEAQNNRPMLSAVVILKGKNIPGSGFFECAKGLGKYDGGDDDRFWADEVANVYNYWRTTK